MNKLKNGLVYAIIFVLVFFIIRYIYMDILYQHTLTMFQFIYYKRMPQNDFLFVLTMILLLTTIITTYVYQIIICKKLNKKFIKTTYIIYFLFLIYFLFFKTVGLKEINLNPLNLIYDLIHGDTLIVLMNIIFFIPLGFIFRLTIKNCILFFIFITFAEIIQFMFSLGILDIIDIICNFVGFVVGTVIIENKKVSRLLFLDKVNK